MQRHNQAHYTQIAPRDSSAALLVAAVLAQAARDAQLAATTVYQYRDRYGSRTYSSAEAKQWLAEVGVELAERLCWMGDDVRQWLARTQAPSSPERGVPVSPLAERQS